MEVAWNSISGTGLSERVLERWLNKHQRGNEHREISFEAEKHFRVHANDNFQKTITAHINRIV